MEIVDKATKQSYIISNYDGDYGAPDYMRDISGDDDNITYNQDTGQYEADMATIQWWLDYVDGMRNMTVQYDALLDALSELNEDDMDIADWYNDIRYAVGDAQGNDYELHADMSIIAMQDWISDHVVAPKQPDLLAIFK